jgi:hypothetical protein
MYLAASGLGGIVAAVAVWLLGIRRMLFAATVIVAVTGAMMTAAAVKDRPGAVVAFVLLAAVSPGLAVIDAVAHRLPFVVTGALTAAMVVGFGWEAFRSGDSAPLERAAWAALVVGILSLAYWRSVDGQLGLGDVGLLVVIGGFTGWVAWAAVWGGVALGFALAAVTALVTRWAAGTSGVYLPLGPWLLVGCWAAIALTISS